MSGGLAVQEVRRIELRVRGRCSRLSQQMGSNPTAVWLAFVQSALTKGHQLEECCAAMLFLAFGFSSPVLVLADWTNRTIRTSAPRVHNSAREVTTMQCDETCVCGHPQSLHRTYGCNGTLPNPDLKKTERIGCQCKAFQKGKAAHA